MTNEEKILEMLGQMNGRFDRLESRMDSLESHINSLESRVDSLDSRVDSLKSQMDKRMDSLEFQLNTRMDSLENRVGAVESVVIRTRDDTSVRFNYLSSSMTEVWKDQLLLEKRVRDNDEFLIKHLKQA